MGQLIPKEFTPKQLIISPDTILYHSRIQSLNINNLGPIVQYNVLQDKFKLLTKSKFMWIIFLSAQTILLCFVLLEYTTVENIFDRVLDIPLPPEG